MEELGTWLALAERLPPMLDSQFQAYRRLAHLDLGTEDGPRELAAWENARKASLSHLQALIRIYDLVRAHLNPAVRSIDADSDKLDTLLAEVRRELSDTSADDAEDDF